MAKFHYDLTGAEPIIRDVPIYAAATIAKGEMIQMAATGAAAAAGFITSNALTTTTGVDSLGVCLETITTTSSADHGDIVSTAATTSTAAISSIASTVATGSRYGKAIINPYAVYLMHWANTGTAATDCFTGAACTASTTYTDTVEQYVAGAWFYVTPTNSSTADAGQLRYVASTSTTASWTFLNAATVTTSDVCMLIRPINWRLCEMTATAGVESELVSEDNDAGQIVSYHSVENYVGGKNRPMERLRAQNHAGITDTTLEFYTDIVQLDHCYCAAVNL